MGDSNPNNRLNLSAGVASVSVALVLVLLKLWALGETGSLAVAASLVDSGLDLLVSLGGLWAIIYASRPPDADHAFGHSSVEDLTALGQSVFIIVSAALIAVGAFNRLFGPAETALASEWEGMVVMAIAIVITLALVLWQRRVARKTGSKVVAADSLHYVGDLIPNIGAIIALFASARFGLQQVDSVVALLAAAIMAGGALRIGREAWDALMDRGAPQDVVDGIGAIVAGWPGVYGYHDLKTRTAGSRIFVNLHIELDADQSLRDAHAIGAALRRAIIARYPQADVIIHHDPLGDPEED